MSFSHDYTILSHFRASSADGEDQQHTESLLDSPYDTPIRGRDSASAAADLFPASECTSPLQPPPLIPRLHEPEDDDMHDTVFLEQVPTITMFWEELRILALYSLPIFGTQLFEYSFIIASVVSIGHISTPALAAATLGSMTASVTGYCIVQGFASTLDTLLPPTWTSDRPYMVGLWCQRMVLMTGMILIPIFVFWFSAEPVFLALNQEPEVARLAAVYLRWASLGLPAYTVNCVSRRYFQSQGLFDIPTRITLMVAPINAFLNWLFVYPFGLSFPGAPLATSLSFNLVSAASVFYGCYYAPPTAWPPITRESLNPITGEIWKGWGILVRLGIAGVGQTATEWWGWELIGLAASQLGPVALAAQSVLLLSASSTYQASFAVSIAASVREITNRSFLYFPLPFSTLCHIFFAPRMFGIRWYTRIGNLLGQGNARRAGIAATTSLVLAAAIGCFCSIIFLTFRHKWGYLFNSDLEVVSLVASILPLVALFQIFDGTAGIAGGIFRARGRQSTGAILNLTAYYVVGIPLGLYLAFVRGHALAGLWEGLTVALVYCSAVGIWTGVRGVDWIAEVATAQSRVRGKDEDRERDE